MGREGNEELKQVRGGAWVGGGARAWLCLSVYLGPPLSKLRGSH